MTNFSRAQRIFRKKIDLLPRIKDGNYINIEIVDVNNDGRLDVLTSVSGVRGMPGKVICYEVPEKTSFDKGTWKKHILSTEFSASQNYRTISPGGVYAFYPGILIKFFLTSKI